MEVIYCNESLDLDVALFVNEEIVESFSFLGDNLFAGMTVWQLLKVIARTIFSFSPRTVRSIAICGEGYEFEIKHKSTWFSDQFECLESKAEGRSENKIVVNNDPAAIGRPTPIGGQSHADQQLGTDTKVTRRRIMPGCKYLYATNKSDVAIVEMVSLRGVLSGNSVKTLFIDRSDLQSIIRAEVFLAMGVMQGDLKNGRAARAKDELLWWAGRRNIYEGKPSPGDFYRPDPFAHG